MVAGEWHPPSVSCERIGDSWVVKIRTRGKERTVGTYASPKNAAKAMQRAAAKAHEQHGQ